MSTDDFRDAGTGRFVTAADASARPGETIHEHRHTRPLSVEEQIEVITEFDEFELSNDQITRLVSRMNEAGFRISKL